jgi:hypothetical protein
MPTWWYERVTYCIRRASGQRSPHERFAASAGLAVATSRVEVGPASLPRRGDAVVVPLVVVYLR